MASEQEVNGNIYRIGNLNAKQQFHVARKLAPVIAGMAAGNMFQGMAEAMAKMPDADVDYVMRVTMTVVTRKQADRYAPVWNTQSDQPQFADMDAGTLLHLMITVIQDNLGGFTNGLGGAGLSLTTPTVQNGPLN